MATFPDHELACVSTRSVLSRSRLCMRPPLLQSHVDKGEDDYDRQNYQQRGAAPELPMPPAPWASAGEISIPNSYR
jgi:hypothetical protein